MTEWNLIPRTLQFLARWMTTRSVWRLAFGCIIVVEAAMLLWVGRQEWYFFDEWRLVVERVVPTTDGLVEQFQLLFRPDGEHVIGLPLAIFVPVVRYFGIDTYWPFIVINIVVRVVTLFVVDDICRRLNARRVVRLLAIAAIAFFGEGWESIFGQSLMFAGFTLIFGLLALRQSIKPEGTQRRDGAISAFWLSCSILSSSYGFPVVVGVALFYLLTRRRRAALASLAVPPAVFFVVRILAGGEYAQQQPLSLSKVPLYIHYVQGGLAAVGEGITGWQGVGLAGFVAVLIASLLLVTDERARLFIISTTVAIVAFYFEASLSRSVLGSEQGRAASRYTFFCGVLAIIMIAAAWGQRRVTSRWAGVVVVLATVSFANNISVLGDGSAFYTDRMQISRARLALGFEIIDRGMAEFAPDPEFASDLSGDRLHAVLDSPYDDEFMVEAKRCFQRWDDELSRAGVAADSLPDEQRAALLVLLSEHSLGAGSAEATLKELIEVAAFNDAESGLFAQFSEAYGQLLNAPPTPTDFVPSTVRCT